MNNQISKKDDRRFTQRYNVSLLGLSINPRARISAIEITNISASGLQFNVDQIEMMTLLPNDTDKNMMNPTAVELNFEVPTVDTSISKPPMVKVECGIVYVRRISLSECAVGCRFENFLENSNEILTRYISAFCR